MQSFSSVFYVYVYPLQNWWEESYKVTDFPWPNCTNKLLGIIAIFSAIKILLSITDICGSSIQLYYSYILCWVILHDRMIIGVIINFIGVYCNLKYNSEVVYCMNSATEMSLELQNKISVIEEKIKYFQEQAIAADRDFKEVLSTKASYEIKGAMPEWQREYQIAESALKDSNVNLQSEKRMLNLLKAKLERGDYAMTSTSTAAKRKFTD